MDRAGLLRRRDGDYRPVDNLASSAIVTRAHAILARLAIIEQEARALMKWGDLPTLVSIDEPWKTHPLAIEHRQLMREWWTLPNADVMDAIYGNRFAWDRWGNLPDIRHRMLTSKGRV